MMSDTCDGSGFLLAPFDEGAACIVVISLRTLLGVAGRHEIAAVVEKFSGEKRGGSSGASFPRHAVGHQPALDGVEQRLLHYWIVFTGVTLLLVNDLAQVDAVLQQVSKGANGKGNPAYRPRPMLP
jgi:hypothetical protein